MIILIPLLLTIISASVFLTNLFEDLFTEHDTTLMIYSVISLLFLTIVPNLVSGLLTPSKKMVLLNSLLIMSVEIVGYIFFVSLLFRRITIANLPINLILSLAFAYLGQRISARRFFSS